MQNNKIMIIKLNQQLYQMMQTLTNGIIRIKTKKIIHIILIWNINLKIKMKNLKNINNKFQRKVRLKEELEEKLL